MKFLITGAAGFIGYSISHRLLKNNHNVIGIDNFDNYYSPKYKKERIKRLNKYKNFEHHQIDITDAKKINFFFKKKKF